MAPPQARPDLTRTTTQLAELAWSIAKERYRATLALPSAPEPDWWSPEEHRRRAALARLRAYKDLAEVMEINAEQDVLEALNSGAGYAEIAEARGVSRQAVRQHVNRTRKDATLVGGPRDGHTYRLPPAVGETLCWKEGHYSTRPHFEIEQRNILSCYQRKGSAGQYAFVGYVDDRGDSVPSEHIAALHRRLAHATDTREGPSNPPPAELPRRLPVIRVYQLAKQTGQTSKQVLSLLEQLGVYVKSASSVVAPPAANRVREHVKRTRPPGD